MDRETALDLSLLEASREHATSAFEGLLKEAPSAHDLRTAAIHAGTAVELVAKALVYRLQPLLMFEFTSPESRLAYVRDGCVITQEQRTKMKSVSACEAVKLAEAAVGVAASAHRASHVLGVRNGAVHLAEVPAEPLALADALAQFLRLMLPKEYTLEDVDESFNLLVKDAEPVHQPTRFLLDRALADDVQERHGATYIATEEKVNKAKKSHEEELARFAKQKQPPEWIEERRSWSEFYGFEALVGASGPVGARPVDCPACSRTAMLWADVESITLDEDGSFDADYVQRFSCGVCELELNADEIHAWETRSPLTNGRGFDPWGLEDS